ncbi:hypothetical protein Aph01nite_73810 [Acrocarpospora phusangensis]|uniref:Uncharacterized protein n=1 Tax=Acrocarpospora phusangensis TaxID=1070424 RepID=A0A919UNZ8_9ACTN|nr:hypothetical protein [Acrocarpospora phusangensis]GIH29071.1 hypothetical protein Aph01nite_73810 [Acrocarpospora phusangensis]
MSLLHAPRWEAIERLGNVATERCTRTRLIVAPGPLPDPADIAQLGMAEALAWAWPDLAADRDYLDRLAGIALDFIRPELGR